MIVGTTEAAHILKISTARLRVLLIAGRVQGAYKTGRMWLIPLVNGKPIIQRGTRGPAPRWRNPRKPAKTIIHVNSQRIRQNQNQQQQLPVITVKKRCDPAPVSGARERAPREGKTNTYGDIVEIPGGCRVVYNRDNPICGARVWIETLTEVKVMKSG